MANEWSISMVMVYDGTIGHFIYSGSYAIKLGTVTGEDLSFPTPGFVPLIPVCG